MGGRRAPVVMPVVVSVVVSVVVPMVVPMVVGGSGSGGRSGIGLHAAIGDLEVALKSSDTLPWAQNAP